MQCLDARIASFAAVTRPKKSAKPAFPLDPKTHPHLTPQALAAAGFFHFPSKDGEPDECKCFMCDLVLGGWDADDDPFVEHVKRDVDCAWMEVVCRAEVDRMQGGPGRLRKVYPDANSLPSSASSAKLREATFGDWWPHAKPTPKEVAEGGFIYTPTKSSPDGTTCPFCKYEVVEWEETDDPLAIHKRKEPQCPFFTAVADKKAPASKTRAKQPARRGRSTVTSTREPEPEETGDNSLELPDAEAMMAQAEEEEAPAPRRRGRQTKASLAASQASTAEPPVSSRSTKSAAAPRGGRRKTAASKKEEIQEEQEPEPAPEAEPEPEQPKRATKPLPRKRTTRTTNATVEPEAEAEPAPAPKPRGRPKKVVPSEASSAPPSQLPVPTSAPSTRGKSASTRAKAKPLSQADSITNVPVSSSSGVLSPKSPSVRHAVASMLREASPVIKTPVKAAPAPAATTPVPPSTSSVSAPAPLAAAPSAASSATLASAILPSVSSATPAAVSSTAPAAPAAATKETLPPLTDEQRKMTLEEYIRQQYEKHAHEMRADGEAAIQKFEAKAREKRMILERG